MCRCPNGTDGGHHGDLGKADDTGYVDEYENDRDYNRCDGCIWIAMEKRYAYGNASWTVKVPPKTQGTFTVLRDPGGIKPLIGDSRANKVYYRIDGGSWTEASGGNNNIPYSNNERTYQFKNEAKAYRKVEFHPNTTYF